jgi:Uma2 family endonuclease
MNSIMVIHPYKNDEMWVFDDEKVGLLKEPFVAGADRIIDRMVATIPNAESGFSLIFSAQPFPGYQVKFEWRREEYRGNWYYVEALDIEGWLCPALFKYFDETPQEIYAQCRAIAA